MAGERAGLWLALVVVAGCSSGRPLTPADAGGTGGAPGTGGGGGATIDQSDAGGTGGTGTGGAGSGGVGTGGDMSGTGGRGTGGAGSGGAGTGGNTSGTGGRGTGGGSGGAGSGGVVGTGGRGTGGATIAPGGDCVTGDLADAECAPTPEEQLERACQTWMFDPFYSPPISSFGVRRGSCGAYHVVHFRVSLGGSTCYYTTTNPGALVGGRSCTDYPAYCAGRASCVRSGEIGSCDLLSVPTVCPRGTGGAAGAAGAPAAGGAGGAGGA
jgi:hypothetical protein